MFKLTWRSSSVFIVKSGHISHSSVSTVNFEQAYAGWANVSTIRTKP